MGIYRAYDIRGTYGKDIDEKTVEAIARAFARLVDGRRLVAACDVRPSSPALKQSLLKGLVDSGIDVIDAGTIPTPLFYFSIVRCDCDGGAMVTASHNPPEYNGMKLCGKEGGMVKKMNYETGLAEIEKIVGKEISGKGAGKGAVAGKPAKPPGSVTAKNIVPEYEAHLAGKIRPSKRLRVGVDCGNGVAGSVAPAMLKKIGCEVHELYCNPDPSFPNHIPDPTKEDTLNDLKKLVLEKKLDLGIAIDGDGDRVVFIDEKGGIVRGDVALAVFAEKILAEKPGATFISEVKVSRGAFERIEALGGRTHLSRVGHSYLHEEMKKTGAEAAGELSGHFYFRDNYANDDGIYAAAKMVEIIASAGRLSALAAKIPKYFSTPEIRLHCPEEKKFSIVEKTAAALKKRFDVVTIDGVRVELPNAWGLVRASNTEPVLTLRFEGKTEKDLKEVKGILAAELGKHGVKIP